MKARRQWNESLKMLKEKDKNSATNLTTKTKLILIHSQNICVKKIKEKLSLGKFPTRNTKSPTYTGEKMGGLAPEASPGQKSCSPYLKNKTKAKWARGVSQVVECLPSRYRPISSNPNTWKRRRRGREGEEKNKIERAPKINEKDKNSKGK
jgi:hypothetical protein